MLLNALPAAGLHLPAAGLHLPTAGLHLPAAGLHLPVSDCRSCSLTCATNILVPSAYTTTAAISPTAGFVLSVC